MEFPFPEYIQLYPTTRCNQRCSFCFNPENSSTNDLDFNKALILLDILDANSIKGIDIMGGEPFLLPWLFDFVKIAISRGMSLNISTNGSKPDLLQQFIEISPDDFNIGISLEGSTAKKHNRLTGSNNFASALESLKRLVDLSLNPIVKTVLSPDTKGDIQNIVNLIRGIGVRRYYIIHMDILRKEDLIMKNIIDYTAFLGIYQKIQRENPDIAVHRVNASCFDSNSLPPGVRCAGGVRKLSVMPDGAVYPCNLFHGLEGFGLGNIFKDSFEDIWSNQRLDLFRRHQKNSCSIYTCKNHASCTGGCPAHSFYHYWNSDTADIRCLRARGY
jgi:radical SAM protein with 4Fe4S-binding SPASM domain